MLTTRRVEVNIPFITRMNCAQCHTPRNRFNSRDIDSDIDVPSTSQTLSMTSPKVIDLHLKLCTLESSLEIVKESIATLSDFIRTHTPASTPTPSVSESETSSVSSSEIHKSGTESFRIALTYITAILSSLRNRINTIRRDLKAAGIRVKKLKERFIKGIRCGSTDGCGGEWGYIDEWIEEMRDLYKVIDCNFKEIC